MAHKLFIGGIAFSTSTERLRALFAEVGTVESATVVTDRDTGQSRGFGFVEMASLDAANSALRQLNGHELDGRQLRIELANPSTGSRGPRGGGGRPAGGNRW
jgi:RNA recognition motif-containing protein